MFYIGLDISKDNFTYCIIDNSARILKKDKLPQSLEGFQELLSILQNFFPATILMESSGRYHIPLASFLISHGFKPFIVNPKFTYQFHKFLQATSPSKSDFKDAFILALFALKNPELLASSTIPDDAKILARTLQSLKKELAQVKTQILQTLSVLFPELSSHLNPFSKTLLSILLHFPSAKHIAKAKPYQLEAIFFDATQRGRSPSFTIPELISLAKKSTGIPHKGFALTLQSLIRKLFFLEEEIEALEKALDEEISNWSPKEKELLSRIKGLSKDLVNIFLAEVGDIKRFSNSRKLIKYAGLDPVIKQSGKWISYRGISKKGSPYLRNILYQMAYGLKTWNEVFRAYFRKKWKSYGSARKAMIALINKMVRVLYAILTKNEDLKSELVAPSIRSQFVSYGGSHA